MLQSFLWDGLHIPRNAPAELTVPMGVSKAPERAAPAASGTPWAKIVSKGLSQAAEAEVAAAESNTTAGKPKVQSRPSAEKAEAGAAAPKAGSADESSQQAQDDKKPQDEKKQTSQPTGAGAPAQPSKPAWTKPVVMPESGSKTPLADIHSSPAWPSLGDAKSEPQKKRSAEATALKSSPTAMENKSPPKQTKDLVSNPNGSSTAGQPGAPFPNQDRRHGGRGGRGGGRTGSNRPGGSDTTWNATAPSNSRGGRSGGRGKYSAQGGRGTGGRGGQSFGRESNQLTQYPPKMQYVAAPLFYPQAAFTGPDTSARSQIMDAVRAQIDYYFSVENLCKDVFLRSKMDNDGYIPLGMVANFNRVRMLTPDPSLIIEALQASTVVELSPDHELVRVRGDHQRWVLPPQQRDLAHKPRPAKDNVGKDGNADGEDETEEDMFQLDEEHEEAGGVDVSETAQEEHDELDEQDIAKLIIVTQNRNGRSGASGRRLGKDAEHAIKDGLLAYEKHLRDKPHVKNDSRRPPKHQQVGTSAQFYGSSLSKGSWRKSSHMGESPPVNSVGWLMGSTPPLGTSPDSAGFIGLSGTSPGSHGRSHRGSSLGSSPRFQHPGHAMLEENGFQQVKYAKWRNRCLQERETKGIGMSDEMNTLFRFWTHFLRESFSQAMYEEFKQLAEEDRESNYHYGMECLFRFYSYGLEKKFRESLYNDFEKFTLEEYERGDLYGLEKLWAFHHYHGLPEGCNIEIHPKLKLLFDTEFRTLDDFRKHQPKVGSQGKHDRSWSKKPHDKSGLPPAAKKNPDGAVSNNKPETLEGAVQNGNTHNDVSEDNGSPENNNDQPQTTDAPEQVLVDPL